MNRSLRFTFLFSFLGIVAFAQQPFLDVSAETGLSINYGTGSFGGGLSFADFNGDGWDDLTFATQNGDLIEFFINTGGAFAKIEPSLTNHNGEAKQVLWADHDNDGDQDLLVTGLNSDNILYTNLGNFLFSQTILPAPDTFDVGPTFGAAFSDIDRDGFLDIFIFNKTVHLPIPNQYFHNNGDGTFTDLTANYFFNGIYEATFCGSFLDINNDLHPDLYTSEDKISVNQLYKNIGNNQFENITEGCGADIIIDAMNVGGGDYDKDGDLDIYVSNTPGGNVLLHNDGNEGFYDVASETGTAFYSVGWGANWLDFDLDTDLDLFLVGSAPNVSLENRLYINNGDATFSTSSEAWSIQDSTRSFSNAIGDFNQDGFPDIAVHNMNPDPSMIWENQGSLNHFLNVDLEGTNSNRDGIGAWVEVYVNQEKLVRFTTCGTAYLAQNSRTQFFGVGDALTVDSLIVRWPSGWVDKLENIPTDQRIRVVEGLSTSIAQVFESSSINLMPNPADESLFIEWPGDYQNVQIVDVQGRMIKTFNALAQQNTLEVNTGDLPNGLYFVILSGPSGRMAERFMVNH